MRIVDHQKVKAASSREMATDMRDLPNISTGIQTLAAKSSIPGRFGESTPCAAQGC
ncbi:MAG TPA: hypothetical protein VIE67_10805 [Rudaea sp.]|jgi:hypothetical protein|uniref:hypothetical protein n=1 Tax=Rudaea sp. TaxID=2136325 RepID=UPI002F91EF66